jgi:hypothetical protein
MDKTLITVDVPNVVSVLIILLFGLVLYALVVQYLMKWLQPSPTTSNGSGF